MKRFSQALTYRSAVRHHRNSESVHVRVARKGWGQPAFYNTEAIVQELMNAGKTLADARRGGTSGMCRDRCVR
ncbi:MAG: pyruvate formate lyase family protein [Dorea sp.]